jgi:hypothetical protein
VGSLIICGQALCTQAAALRAVLRWYCAALSLPSWSNTCQLLQGALQPCTVHLQRTPTCRRNCWCTIAQVQRRANLLLSWAWAARLRTLQGSCWRAALWCSCGWGAGGCHGSVLLRDGMQLACYKLQASCLSGVTAGAARAAGRPCVAAAWDSPGRVCNCHCCSMGAASPVGRCSQGGVGQRRSLHMNEILSHERELVT